jgi:hypothetical protein
MEPCTKVDFTKDDDVTAIIQTIRQESNVFTLSSEQLAKSFLKKSLCDDFSAKSFDEMRSAYIEATRKEDVPDNADGLYTYILKSHFRYWQEPKSVLLEYYERAIKDWNEVEDRIKKLKVDIDVLSKSDNPTRKQEELPVLYFYLKHTEIALSEIMKFIKKEIHEFVLRKCSMPIRAEYPGSIPYDYYLNAQYYDVSQPTMISNKFMYTDYEKRKDIVEMYDNRKEDFKKFLREYVESHNVIDAIRYAYEINYFFNRQRDLIKEALDVYENGNYILFSSACFLIVEGLLHDICLQLGVDKSAILGFPFQKKVDIIHDVYKVDIDYQYYSFKFRVLRNEVVHGTANPDGLRENADLLLLDLVNMIDVTKSNHILFNPKRFFLYSALKEDKDKFDYVAGYIILNDTKIPDFYNSYEAHNKLIEMVEKDDFWNYVDKLCSSQFSYEQVTGVQILKKINGMGIADVEEKCSKMLKRYKGIKYKFDLNNYLKGILQYTYWM